MGATPIYGKNLQKSSLKPVDRFPRNMVFSIGDSGPIIVCSNDDPRLTMTDFAASSNCVTSAGEEYFSEIIAACDLKVGRCRKLIELMKVSMGV